MPNWNDILYEIKAKDNKRDAVRRKYLSELFEYTDRNIILYYSGWLQNQNLYRRHHAGFQIYDDDKTGFMSTIHEMDKDKGLDLFLHTPGGSMAAVESLVEYLHSIFGYNIRAVVPELALSGGSMIACACKEIVMGKHSSLGPIDPQINGLPAHGIIEEFEEAKEEIEDNEKYARIWHPIIANYNPTLIGESKKAIEWAEEMVEEWLKNGMFQNEDRQDADNKINEIINQLGDHAYTKSHNRHISINKAKDMGLKVIQLEEDPKLQEKILTVHHSVIISLMNGIILKLIENHKGVAFIKSRKLD